MINIFQIYHDKALIPIFVKEHIKKLNPGCKYHFIDFIEGKKIINNNIPNENLKRKILYCMENYPRWCHKSDLLRYCLLYIYGGVYLDVDLKPLIAFDEMKSKDVDFFTSFGRGGEPYMVNKTKIYPITSNGILISKKNNPILLDLIYRAINDEKLFNKDPKYRGRNVYYLYNYLNEKCKEKKHILAPFKKISIHSQNIYLANHILIHEQNLDYIVDKNRIIVHANHPNYIFKRQTSSFI